MTIEFRPLGKAFGAELRGIELNAGIGERERQALSDGLRDHQVLLLRNQTLDPETMTRLGRMLGDLEPAPSLDVENCALPGFPQIAVVSNVMEAGRPLGGLGSGELAWHSDMTFRQDPPVACALFAVEVPEGAGNTHFLSLVAAADRLRPELRERIQGLRAFHDRRYTSAGTPRHQPATEQVAHPLLAKEPLSGRPILLLGRRLNSEVEGLGPEESKALLDELWNGLDDPELAITHRWRKGDVLFWANLAVMHKRDSFDGTARRVLHRLQFGRFRTEPRAAA
jgi:taurine dioxygenase